MVDKPKREAHNVITMKNTNDKGATTMTTDQSRLAGEGRDYWAQYVKLNGYAWSPQDTGLQRLSRNLDVNIPHLRKCINLYLEA